MASEIIILSSSPPKQLRTLDMPFSPPFPFPSEMFHSEAPALRGGSRATPIPENASASSTTAASLFRRASIDDTFGKDTIESSQGTIGNGTAIPIALTKRKPKAPKQTSTKNDGGEGQVAKVSRITPAKKKETREGVTGGKKLRESKAKRIEKEFDEDGNPVQKPLPKRRAKAMADYDKDGNIIKKPPPKPRTKKKAEMQLDGHGNIKQKAVRNPRAKAIEREASALVRKPRAKKTDTDPQAKLPKPRITKPVAGPSLDKQYVEPAKSESTSKHFTTARVPVDDVVEYGLAPAIKRRTAWTPPAAAARSESLDFSTVDQELDGGISSEVDTVDRCSKKFPDFLSSFGFSGRSASASRKLFDGISTNKRKLIELVRTNSSTSTTSEAAPVQKKKATKKKARTLTDLATSEYAPKDEVFEKPAPILQYFSYHTTDRMTSDGFRVPPMPRSKSPIKNSGKGTAQAPILLSPESALKQVGKQDFVFGTSSQLAREESPTFLRDIHTAMQASNEVDEDDPFVDSILATAASSIASIKGNPISFTKRSLWSAAARDTSGELMNIEMVDMVGSPAIVKELSSMNKGHACPPAKISSPSATLSPSEVRCGKYGKEDIWHDIDEIATATPLQPNQRSSKPIGPIETAIREDILNSAAKSLSLPSPKRLPKAKQIDSTSKSVKSPTKSSWNKNPQSAGMPDFPGYTTTQLTKEIASYRFKPIKNRDQMITLLEKCWESKQRMALAALGNNTAVKKSSQDEEPKLTKEKSLSLSQIIGTSPKRPRGRPKKDITAPTSIKQKVKRKSKTASNLDLELDCDSSLSQIRTPKKAKRRGQEATEDISDSDINMTPSPPRRHPSQIRSPPLALQTSSATLLEASPDLSPKSSPIELYNYITQAVRTTLPSTDPKDPSWHEKILLYDPIILEDLTIWLNTGGLGKVGWDGEVDPKEVKKWCESKSICCLWKENLRGGARSRY